MKVAVIGAGFSGMLAAYLLEKKGIDVTIYEKEERIGGHCRTLVSKNVYTDLGTVFSFNKHIKELLLELGIDYSERFIYRNFVDETYQPVEHLSRLDVAILMNELEELRVILNLHNESLKAGNYQHIDDDLLMTLDNFLNKYNLKVVKDVLAPLISSYGFGDIFNTQAYYVFKVFNVDTIYSFIRGDKLLFFNKGTSELINKLSEKISDIRYSLEVKNIETINNQVKVDTPFGSDIYDKVLITTKLPRDVIKDTLYNNLMKKIQTNPYITCAYEVKNSDLVTTYFKSNLGKQNKIQFFYSSRQKKRTIIVAYAYGIINKEMIDGITHDLKAIGVDIKQLITVKQWYIFPHLKAKDLNSNFYSDIHEKQKESNICLIGSLVNVPSIDRLYSSVKTTINDLF
jgi:protoporphyrinogen oxidase